MRREKKRVTMGFCLDNPNQKTAYEFLGRLDHKKTYFISELLTYLECEYGAGWDSKNVDRFLQTLTGESEYFRPSETPAKLSSRSVRKRQKITNVSLAEYPLTKDECRDTSHLLSDNNTKHEIKNDGTNNISLDPHYICATEDSEVFPVSEDVLRIRMIDFAKEFILSSCPEDKRQGALVYWKELEGEGDYDSLYEEVISYYGGSYPDMDKQTFEEFIMKNIDETNW